MSRIVTLVLFLVLVVGGGVLIGTATAPGAWYEGLTKPAFNPPNWIFAPVWTTLYVMIAVAGWRVWSRTHTAGAMTIWWLQLGLNFLWSPVFFTLHAIGPAFVIILALLFSILAFISVTRRWDRVSALLFVPYAAWVAFAALLNGSILVLN
jgi:translocator protein